MNGRSWGLVSRLVVNGGENIFFSDFCAQSCRQMTQQSEPALAYNAFRLFHHNAKETVDFAVVAGERTVGKSVVGFFCIAAALQEQEQSFIPCCLARFQHGTNARV